MVNTVGLKFLFLEGASMKSAAGQEKYHIYLSIVSILALAVLIQSSLVTDFSSLNINEIIFFLLVSIVAESLSIELPKGGHISVTFAIDLACIIALGPSVSIWIAMGSALFNPDNLKGKTPLFTTLFNCSSFVLTIWSAGMVYLALGGTINSYPALSVVPLIGAVLTYVIVNSGTVSIFLGFLKKTSPWSIWLSMTRGVAPSLLALTPLALLMASIYKVAGVWGVSFFFIPLLLARYMFKAYMEVRKTYMDTLEALASALDAKDRYTKGHSDRVALIAVAIARELKIPDDRIEIIEQMARLHDIGKIGISGKILTYTGKLSDDEFEQIKQHPVIGANILKEINDFESSTDFVKYHHEKYNGTGYPYRIKGEEIPLEARIITLADSFDAMTSDRSYRKAMTVHEALEEVKRSSGTHFDPIIVEAFLKCWETVVTGYLKSSQNLINSTAEQLSV